MAIFNNSDLFANPFEKTKSVSGSKNVQNPFGDQKIPNYMELFQFNDATKPIDFVELKDDKSSDKKSSNSTELTMEEDVSVKDKLSWEKILGVEWKRGKDTSVTQKDGEKIFESTVKNVVSGEERKIKTVIHKDKETCSTYMSVNGTPEGNPYSKLIQELKGMGESATAEATSVDKSSNAKAKEFEKCLLDNALAVSENGKTRLKSAKIDGKSVEPTGDVEYYAGKNGNQYLQQSFKDKATGEIYRVTYQAAASGEVSEIDKDINEIKKAETANSTAGAAGAPQNRDGNANVTEESETPVNNAAPDADDSAVTSDKDPAPTNQNVEQQNKTPAQGSDSTAETIKREETRIDANGKKIHITYNALPAEVDENYDPGEGWFQIEKDGQKYFKHEASGLVFDLVKSKYGDGTTLELSKGYYKGSKDTAETKVGANNETKNITTKSIDSLKITYNTPDADRYNPNYTPGEGWEKATYTSGKKKVDIWKNSGNGLLFQVGKAQTGENNATRTTFNWTANLFDETNLTKALISNGNEAPDIGENYTKTHYVDKGDKIIVTYKNKHRPQNLLFTFKVSNRPTISKTGTVVYQWDGNTPETRDLSDLYT